MGREVSVKSFRFKKSEIGIFSDLPDEVADMIHKNRIIGLTNGRFSLIDLIHSILKKVGRSEVVICTSSAGIKDAFQVKWLIDTELIDKLLLITDHSYVNRQKKYALTITDLFGSENIRTAEIHAKFVLISNKDHTICIRTSMNLNANKTCENFEIDTDRAIFDFYMDFVNHVCKQDPGFESRSFVVSDTLRTYFSANRKSDDVWGHKYWGE